MKLSKSDQSAIRQHRLKNCLTQREAGAIAWPVRSEKSAREGWAQLETRDGLSVSEDSLQAALHVVGLELIQEIRPRAA